MPREQFANDLGLGTTLTAAVTDTTGTSITVASTAGMPTVPQFRLRVDSEIFLVVGVAGTTLTVVRGAEGTTADTHANGATVIHVLTAASIQAPGRMFAAYPAAPVGYLTPDLSQFSWANQGAATATINALGTAVTLTDPSAPGEHMRMLKLSSGYPTTPFTVTAYFQNNAIQESYHPCGIYVGDGTKIIQFSIRPSSATGGCTTEGYKFSSATAFSGYYFQLSLGTLDSWQQFSDDGTNRICRVSRDGLNWVVLHSIARTDFLTPSEVGMAWQAESSPAHSFVASWIHWQVS